MRIRIFPYKQASRSARALAAELNGLRLRRENSTFRPRGEDLIINWGASDCPFEDALNPSEIVETASNKLKFFRHLENKGLDYLIPEFWVNAENIPDECFPIVCRTILNGHSGNGIVIADSREELVEAPLYTQYKKKKDEYRVHIGRGEVIDVQKKAKRRDVDDVNYRIRNHGNGFIYMREGINIPEIVTHIAKSVVAAFPNLMFGAVDVIYNNHYREAWALEINTAPGLEGTTLSSYKKFFQREFLNNEEDE